MRCEFCASLTGAHVPSNECVPADETDSRYTSCEAWCNERFVDAHCTRCACQGCSWCPSDFRRSKVSPPPPPPPPLKLKATKDKPDKASKAVGTRPAVALPDYVPALPPMRFDDPPPKSSSVGAGATVTLSITCTNLPLPAGATSDCSHCSSATHRQACCVCGGGSRGVPQPAQPQLAALPADADAVNAAAVATVPAVPAAVPGQSAVAAAAAAVPSSAAGASAGVAVTARVDAATTLGASADQDVGDDGLSTTSVSAGDSGAGGRATGGAAAGGLGLVDSADGDSDDGAGGLLQARSPRAVAILVGVGLLCVLLLGCGCAAVGSACSERSRHARRLGNARGGRATRVRVDDEDELYSGDEVDDQGLGDHGQEPKPPQPQGQYVKVVYEWGEMRRSGTLLLGPLGSVGDLLEAIVELGESLLHDDVSAAHAEVYFTTQKGVTKRMYVSKTKWEEILHARELVVRKADV